MKAKNKITKEDIYKMNKIVDREQRKLDGNISGVSFRCEPHDTNAKKYKRNTKHKTYENY